MHPGSSPEDLHTILSRFHTWAGKHAAPENGNGRAKSKPEEGIREITYEEALRRHRNQRAQRGPAASPAENDDKARVVERLPVSQSCEVKEALSPWITTLPVVPAGEPVIELKVAPRSGASVKRIASVQKTTSSSPQRSRPSPRPSSSMATTHSRVAELTSPASSADLHVCAYVDLPAVRPQRGRKKGTAAPPTPTRRAAARRAQATTAPQCEERAGRTEKAAKADPPPLRAIQSSPDVRPGLRAGTSAKTAVIDSPRGFAKSLSGGAARGKTQDLRSLAKAKTRSKRPPAFREVLAATIPPANSPAVHKKRTADDRTRRITTRFSRAEERRIEKSAAERGITVSAYLRHCALGPTLPEPLPEAGGRRPNTAAGKRGLNAGEVAPFSSGADPTKSLFGGWLALLRNRFLGPPVRFSGDA
jgi:hypothetical protein